MATSVRVITNKRENHPLSNQQAYNKSCNKRVCLNQPGFARLPKYLHLKHEDDRYTSSVQDRITFWYNCVEYFQVDQLTN